MSLFYCTVNQLVIQFIPFFRNSLIELVNTRNLVCINLFLHKDYLTDCVKITPPSLTYSIADIHQRFQKFVRKTSC